MASTIQVKGVCGGVSGKEDCCHCMKLRNTTTKTTTTATATIAATTTTAKATTTTLEPTQTIQLVTGTPSSVAGEEDVGLTTLTTDAFSTLTSQVTSTTKANTEKPALNTCEDTGCADEFGGQGR